MTYDMQSNLPQSVTLLPLKGNKCLDHFVGRNPHQKVLLVRVMIGYNKIALKKSCLKVDVVAAASVVKQLLSNAPCK